jgi:hypothetical protein
MTKVLGFRLWDFPYNIVYSCEFKVYHHSVASLIQGGPGFVRITQFPEGSLDAAASFKI